MQTKTEKENVYLELCPGGGRIARPDATAEVVRERLVHDVDLDRAQEAEHGPQDERHRHASVLAPVAEHHHPRSLVRQMQHATNNTITPQP